MALLDWLEPLFDGGHWTPGIIALAGGIPVFGDKCQPSQRREWHELVDAAPDIIFIALCGFNVERSLQDVEAFLKTEGFIELHRRTGTQVYLVDGNAYFSRPGPRLVDALEIMANALHPDIHPLPEGMDAAFKQN